MNRVGRFAAAAAIVASGALAPIVTVSTTHATAATAPVGTFHQLARAVLADTRTGLDTDQRAMAANETRKFAVAGHAGIPSDNVAAVLIQVVAERPGQTTTLQVWNASRHPHLAPMTAPAGRETMTTVPVGLTSGAIAVSNGAYATQVRLVVEGWWSTPDGPPGVQLRPVLPRLVFDQTVKAGSPVSVDVWRLHLVPSSSTLMVTLMATGATSSGTVTLAPGDGTPSGYPADLSINPGDALTQTSAVQVGTSYQAISVSTTSLSVRVRLWVSATGGYEGTVADAALVLHPIRVFDTLDATSTAATPIVTGSPRVFRLGGMFGVPDDHVSAVVLGVTATARSPHASVTVTPTDAVNADDGALLITRGIPAQDTRLVRLGTAGRLTVSASGTADVELDVLGWVTGSSLLIPSIQANPPDPNSLDISPSGLRDPVVAPNGETAYAVDMGAPALDRFDLRYGIELAPIPLAAPATGMDLLPGAGAALVVEPTPLTNVRSGEVQTSVQVERVDLATGARTTIPTPARPFSAVDVVQMSDGTLLFAPPGGAITTDAARTVAWMSSGGYAPQGRWDITDRTWLSELGFGAVNDDATVVATYDTVTAAPADGPLRPTVVRPNGQDCDELLLSADGATGYCEQLGNLLAVDVRSGTTQSQAPMPDVPAGPYFPLDGGGAVSPDGRTVVVLTDHGLSVIALQ